MKSRIVMLVALLHALSPACADSLEMDDLFADETYEDGFDAGVAYALSTLAHEAYGQSVTPYPVEVPSWKGDWAKSYQSTIAIHACVKDHMKRGVSQAGGTVDLVYFEIVQIMQRVLSYCGATAVRLPK